MVMWMMKVRENCCNPDGEKSPSHTIKKSSKNNCSKILGYFTSYLCIIKRKQNINFMYMKKYRNYKSFKTRRNLLKINSEMDKLVKVFNKTWNYSFLNESDRSFSMGQEISDKNEEITLVQSQWLKSKFFQRA